MSKIIELVSLLVSQQGDAYEFGVEVKASDSDPKAFDCSELVQWACARLEIKPKMPDRSWVQAQHCKKHGTIISVERAVFTPGALLFFFSSDPFTAINRPKSAHVAVSLGNGMTIEARSKKLGVGIFSAEWRGWTHAGLIPGLKYGNA
jgi:cell wall-associated NlpC family hydrolase